MALHMRIRAAGSSCVICLTASMPPISGMIMSIVTRSGFSCWYFSTACFPFSASPTTVNPAWDRMSLTIVRMNTASSQTSTVLLTLPPLSDYLLNHRLDIENEHPLSIDLYRPSYRTRQRNPRLARRREQVYRHILNVAHIVDPYSDPSLLVFSEENQALRPLEWPLAQRRAAVDHRHNRSTQIDEPADGFRSTWQPRHLTCRDYFPKCVHVARIAVPANVEHQQSPGRYLWLLG